MADDRREIVWDQAKYQARAAELEDLLDNLPARSEAAKDARAELRFIEKHIVSDQLKRRSHFFAS